MLKLFGFCGRKRSGKGVLANVVKEKYDGVIVTAANYLKYICCDILNFSLEELNRKKDDGTTFSLYPDERWFNIIHDKTGIDVQLIKNDISDIEFTNIRQMLQVIGTDCIRKHNTDWHVNCMKKDIQKYLSEGKTVAVDDVRFPNEREVIEKLGGECFFIVRPLNTEISNHISETSLTWDMFDEKHIIINDRSLQKLTNNFIQHLDNNLTTIEWSFEKRNDSLFYCETMYYYNTINLMFGKKHTDIVDLIIKENKNYDVFKKLGIFQFTPGTKEKFVEYRKELYTCNEPFKETNDSDETLLFYHPLINENLKFYIQ